MSTLGGFISARYLEFLHGRYLSDTRNVGADWRPILDQLANGEERRRIRLDPLGRDENMRLPGAYATNAEGTLVVELNHIDDPAMRAWLEQKTAQPWSLNEPARLALARRLIEAEAFEHFLALKMPTKKRFSAEGSEAMIPLLWALLAQSSALGVSDIVVGAMHRGRLNAMANVFDKDLALLFAEMKGAHPFGEGDVRPGDVPYHVGITTNFTFGDRQLRVIVCPNPSHLEAINCVALGRVRALQDQSAAALGLILHTDASVIAQGSVAEMLQLSGVPAFTTQGSVHVVINNQIGFTTEPSDARTSLFCTGAWKAIDSAIIHVNADAPEAVLLAGEIALTFRQTFARDAVIDLVCYRRRGHNELDEPRFTQPNLYRTIDAHASSPKRYRETLVAEGVDTASLATAHASYVGRLHAAFETASEHKAPPALAVGPTDPQTGITSQRLEDLLEDLAKTPIAFSSDAKVERVLKKALTRESIDWPVAEALAFGALLQDGVDITFSGQDIVRGSFSQRHIALHDTETGAAFSRFDAVRGANARLAIANSPLSEYAALAFAYGYSVERPNALTIWEAQFGDFANGAQIIIDQFIVSGAAKWNEHSGLIVLLPHGLEGQGPEHSSARIERFLQMAAEDNIRIANPSTPANYFHLLRRQALQQPKKPLFVIAPKTLLRLPEAVSAKEDFSPRGGFRPVIWNTPKHLARRILFCSGKIAYMLQAAAAKHGDDSLIVRLEQLYPAPLDVLADLVSQAPTAECVWVQEEPENMGAWSYLEPRLNRLCSAVKGAPSALRYCGRREASSPAGSFHGAHDQDQAAIVEAAFTPRSMA